jgi:rhodanese-related sulfurtransferase
MGFLDYFKQPDMLVNLSPDDFERKMKEEGTKPIDVRTQMEYRHGHIEGVELHPLSSIKDLAPQLDKNSHYLLVCATGHRSRAASAVLIRNGVTKVSHLEGGMRAWRGSSKPVVTEK